MRRRAGGEALDSRDRVAVVGMRQRETRIDGIEAAIQAIYEHGACTAFTSLAPRLGAGQM